LTEQTAWLTLQHEETQGLQRVPAALGDADLEFYAARGWHLVDGVDEGTPPGVPAPVEPDPGAPEWVDLVHPLLGATHTFPNNADALEGAREAGWVAPNKDGSVPKVAQRKAAQAAGVDVDDLPDAQGDAAPEEPAGEAGAENNEPAESSATNEKE
jgi:hypothetical protein